MSRAQVLRLRPVSHPKGDANRFCGPSVISALTGMASGEASRLIRAISGKASVQGTSDAQVLRALQRCGIRHVAKWVWPGQKRRTLAAWLRETHGTRGGKVYLIVAGNHWQLVSGNRYVCGRIGDVVELDHPKVKRRAIVDRVYQLAVAPGARLHIPPEARKPKAKPDAGRAPRTEAKALAAAWGVEIEQHTDLDSRPWYVSHPALRDEADPYEGEHYGYDWPDVLERVRAYVAALTALGLDPAQAQAATAQEDAA